MRRAILFFLTLKLSRGREEFQLEALVETRGLTHESEISFDVLQTILNGAERGNLDNIYFLGLLRLYGISLSKNETLAAYQFLKAAEMGHSDAQTAIAVMYLNGHGVGRDENLALMWLRKSVNLGDKNARWILARLLIAGTSTETPQPEKAFTLLSQSNDHLLPEAQFQLALMYEYGMGTSTNYELAVEHYLRAADLGHIQSIYHLALIYAYGRGLTIIQNFPRAISLFEKCARLNYGSCMYYMGMMKMSGQGTETNYEQALHWFESVAGMDDPLISSKASKAAETLRQLLDEANEYNHNIIESYRKKSETF